MSSRSRVVVAGRTMSAMRAVGVHHGSWTTTVSGRCQAAREPVEVLVVVERVAAGPVDEPDVGVAVHGPVELVARRPGRMSMSVEARDG